MSHVEDLSAITTPALTDLLYVYRNGTDYNLTNAQLLALMKENIVIPLTQAQYDALPSADKNNGALYVITDAVITAADIEYSSGVSVADKIDDISTIETLTPTFNDQQSNVSIPYPTTSVFKKYGKVVQIYIGAQVDTPYGTSPGVVVYSNLPKPLSSGGIFSSVANMFGGSTCRYGISSSGELVIRSGTANQLYDISLMYLTND